MLARLWGWPVRLRRSLATAKQVEFVRKALTDLLDRWRYKEYYYLVTLQYVRSPGSLTVMTESGTTNVHRREKRSAAYKRVFDMIIVANPDIPDGRATVTYFVLEPNKL